MDAAVDYLSRGAGAPMLPFLAADVGGTHARVALMQGDSACASGVLAYDQFTCADFPNLAQLLQAFVDAAVPTPVRRCVLACAGQVMGDAVVNDNLAWPIRLSRLRGALAFDDVAILNDFEALGYALDGMEPSACQLLCGPSVRCQGPTLVVGPGTGLGAALRVPGADGGLVLTTEAGQMDFAPTTAREREVLAWLSPAGGYVPYEYILSGPGLPRLYGALCALRGQVARLATPEAVTAAAAAETDACAVEAVGMFCDVLGSFVGAVAMAYMATGGVYLAGGFLSSMIALIQRSHFTDRFLHGRGMRAMLQRVPVRVMAHGRHGVLGAAHWYLGRNALAEPALAQAKSRCEVAA